MRHEDLEAARQSVDALTAAVRDLTKVVATCAEALAREVVVTEQLEVDVPGADPMRPRRTLEEGHQLHMATREARRRRA